MATDYLLLETGDKLILEDASGDLILESSTEDVGQPTARRWTDVPHLALPGQMGMGRRIA